VGVLGRKRGNQPDCNGVEDCQKLQILQPAWPKTENIAPPKRRRPAKRLKIKTMRPFGRPESAGTKRHFVGAPK
jgi:hypothetical protein